MLLKLSTTRTLLIFMTSTSDHIAGKTGLSAGLTIYLSKDGGAAGAITPTVAEIDSANMPGWYSLALTTTHTNTLGDFALHITGSGADPTDLVRQVVTDLPGASVSSVTGAVGSVTGAVGSVTGNVGGNVVGSVASVTGNVGGNVTGSIGSVAAGGIATTSFAAGAINAAAIAADAITAAKVADGTIDAATFAAGAINAAAIAADAITDAKVAADVTIASVTGAVGSVTGAVGSVTGNVGGNVVGSVASVTARVTANTDQLAGQTVTAAAGVTFPASVASPTNITAGTITTAINLTNAPTAGDFTAAMKTSLNAATPAVTVSDKTGFSLSAGGVQAIWDALTSALTTAGSIGKWVVDKLDVVVSTRLATSGYTAPLDAGGTRTAVGLASANLDTQLAAIDADVLTRLATSGYTAPLSAAGTRSAVGLASANLDTQLGAIAGYIDTEVGSIKGVTDKLDTALELDGAVYRYTTNALEQAPTGGTAPTAVAIADEVQTRTIAAVTSVTNDVGITQAAADKVWASATRTLSSFGTLVADVATAVWAAVTRTLTAGTNIVLAKGVGVTGFNDLSAAQVNAEADTALADVGVTSTVTGRIDAAVSSRLATAGYTAPNNAGIASAASDAATAAAGAAAIFARTDVATSTRLAAGSYTAPDNTSIAAILDDTGTSGVAVADKNGYRLSGAGVDDVLRTALTEGYAAQGDAFTLEQALFMLWSLLAERGIVSTTLTSGKLDHSTAMTFQLDDPVTPTAQERAT